MNDKELADKVVALLPDFCDWGERPGQASERYGSLNWHLPKIAHDFVRDWRVAGAMWEVLMKTEYDMVALMINAQYKVKTENMPWSRAITDACMEALT